jgi:hypothetical protein
MAGETLKITGGNASGQTITLEQELVIGRSTPGLGSLGGDSEISRVHARVFHDPSGRLTIEDLGSTNGTFVNGNRISGQQALNPGDQVRVGQTSMTVEGGVADAGATSVGSVIPAAAPPPPAAAQPPPTQPLPPQQPPPYGGQGPGAPPPPPGGPGYAGGPVGGPPQRSGGTNRNVLIAIAAVVVIALVVAGLAIGGVFGGSDDKKSETTAQTTPTTSTTTPSVAMPAPPTTDTATTDEQGGGGSGGYPAGFKQQFIKSCESGGLSNAGCQCAFDEVQRQYTFPELLVALKQAQQGNAPAKIKNIFIKCARENS